MGARNRVEIGLSYQPARLHRLAEFIPWNRFPGSINVSKYALWFFPEKMTLVVVFAQRQCVIHKGNCREE
jgi:hypothetical protein